MRSYAPSARAISLFSGIASSACAGPRTLATKLLEAARALRLEQVWSKDQILAAYLNRLDFGNMNIGVAAAADYYFGKPLADNQAIQWPLVELSTQAQMLRLLTSRGLRTRNGAPLTNQAIDHLFGDVLPE